MNGELRIVEYQNEWIVESPFEFRHEDQRAPALTDLRERYDLDGVIASGTTEWEQILLLREWVHTRWDHGWCSADLRDARHILQRAEAGEAFNCAYYARTFAQSALAVGLQARQVSIAKSDTAWHAPDESNVGHSVCEVWSQDWHKWAVIDADLNAHYELQGKPLSALEIRKLWKDGRWRDASLVKGRSGFRWSALDTPTRLGDSAAIEDLFADFARFNAMDYYAHLRWEGRNDHLSSTEDVPGLRWYDESEPPQLVSGNSPVLSDCWTCDERHAYHTLNQVHITLRVSAWSPGAAALTVRVEDSMPNLDRLLVKLSETEPWRTYTEPFDWPLRAGKNTVAAKAVNRYGRTGYVSRIVLRYFPSPNA